LLPQAKTWRILSKQMGLGKGESKIYQPEVADPELNTVGFINSDSEHGIAMINASSSASMVDMRITHLPMNDFARVEVYVASAENDASTPVYSGLLKVVNNETRLTYPLPAESVVGIKLKNEDLFHFLKKD
jgi:hypothetical protein